LRVADTADVARNLVRGRYGPGKISAEAVRGYLEENGVPPESDTETYVAVRSEIATWRWSGVPFLMRHGKRMAQKSTEVRVQFRTAPLQLFNRPPGIDDAELRRQLREGKLCQLRPNVLTLRIQPREGIALSFGVKQPGREMVMTPAELAFDYRDRFGDVTTPAYERLLLDALKGDPTLFLRSDEIEASWRFADEVRAAWERQRTPPIEYAAGTWGPEQAAALFEGCEGGWAE
jgi:glucose-6-phosphate 1-dehydrogenase